MSSMRTISSAWLYVGIALAKVFLFVQSYTLYSCVICTTANEYNHHKDHLLVMVYVVYPSSYI